MADGVARWEDSLSIDVVGDQAPAALRLAVAEPNANVVQPALVVDGPCRIVIPPDCTTGQMPIFFV